MAEFTLQQQIGTVKREITFREKIYPREVATGKMKQADAELNISEMRAVLKTLQWLEKNRTVVTTAMKLTPEEIKTIKEAWEKPGGVHTSAKTD